MKPEDLKSLDYCLTRFTDALHGIEFCLIFPYLTGNCWRILNQVFCFVK